jgi:hypothetical protein
MTGFSIVFEHPAGIADFRWSIADIRNSKLEIRNSVKTPLRPIGAGFRFSNFDFLLPQSAILRATESIPSESKYTALPRIEEGGRLLSGNAVSALRGILFWGEREAE